MGKAHKETIKGYAAALVIGLIAAAAYVIIGAVT